MSRNGQHIRCSFRQSSADDLRSVVVSTSREHCRLISNNNKCEPSNHQCEMKLRECGLLLDWQVQGTDLEPTEEGTFSAMFVGKVCCNNQCEYFGSSPSKYTCKYSPHSLKTQFLNSFLVNYTSGPHVICFTATNTEDLSNASSLPPKSPPSKHFVTLLSVSPSSHNLVYVLYSQTLLPQQNILHHPQVCFQTTQDLIKVSFF